MGSFIRRSARLLLAALALATTIGLLSDRTAFALDPARSITQLHHTRWSLRDGVPAVIDAIAQTPDGFLWFGSAAGLFRFDGIRAEPFAVGKIPGGAVHSLAATSSGDLWMGLRTHKLGRLRHGELTVFEAPKVSFSTPLSFLVPDPDGTIWVATTDTVYNFDGQNWRTISSPWPSSAAYSEPGGVWGLALAQDGTLWAKNLLGLYYLRRGATAFEPALGYAGSMIDFVKDRAGRLWTADSATLHFYALPDIRPGEPVPQPEFGAALPPLVLGSVRMDRDGSLWNPNRVTGGLQRMPSLTTPMPVERFTPPLGRPSDVFGGMIEDREGSIWVTSSRGLDRFRHANIVAEPTMPIRTQAPEVVATKDAAFVYSGMGAPVDDPSDIARRLYRIGPDGKVELIVPDLGQVEAIAATPDGKLIFAAGGKLMQWDQGVVVSLAMHPDIVGGHVNNIAVADDGGFWVSVHSKGVFRFSAGQWTRIADPASSPIDSPELAYDRMGALWMFYPGGVTVRIADGERTEYPAIGSQIGIIEAISSTPDNIILVGQQGIARFDGKAFQFLLSSRAPVLANGFGIAAAQNGDLWIGTTAGVVRVTRDALLKSLAEPQSTLEFQLFDVADGFGGTPAADVFGSSMVAGPDGRIWIMMNAGVAWIDPAHLYRNAEPPPVVITSVTSGGKVHDMPKHLMLPAGTSQMQIDYTALSLAVPERVRFRYKLMGVDDDWIDAGGRRQAFYTNIEPGDYSFQVIAANNDGVWNEKGAIIGFTIAPTFVQSVWFKILIALGLAALAWLAYTMRLKQQAARLQTRFNVRVAERERIARELHDTLLQGFQGLLLRFQSVANRAPAGSELRASLDQALDRADAVLIDGRARVRDLRATAIEGDLAKAILECAHRAIEEDSPQFRITVEGSSRAIHVLMGEEITRIAEEAIRNAVKHAKAKVIDATLSYGANVRLAIRDDGVGMPPSVLAGEEKVGHFGLLGMRERAQRVGARLDVTSREGAGTEIVLSIPGRTIYRDRPGVYFDKFWPVRSGD